MIFTDRALFFYAEKLNYADRTLTIFIIDHIARAGIVEIVTETTF
jgi:hypothetical protein